VTNAVTLLIEMFTSCTAVVVAVLSPVYTSNNVEATFDFVEAIFDFVAKTGTMSNEFIVKFRPSEYVQFVSTLSKGRIYVRHYVERCHNVEATFDFVEIYR